MRTPRYNKRLVQAGTAFLLYNYFNPPNANFTVTGVRISDAPLYIIML